MSEITNQEKETKKTFRLDLEMCAKFEALASKYKLNQTELFYRFIEVATNYPILDSDFPKNMPGIVYEPVEASNIEEIRLTKADRKELIDYQLGKDKEMKEFSLTLDEASSNRIDDHRTTNKAKLEWFKKSLKDAEKGSLEAIQQFEQLGLPMTAKTKESQTNVG